MNVKPNDVLVKKMKDRYDGKQYATIMFEPRSVLSAVKKMASPEAKKALAGSYMDGTAVVHGKTSETMARMGLNMKLSGLVKEVEQWVKKNTKGMKEDVDMLSEMDPAKHVSMNKETGMYCVYNKKGEKVKEFKDKKDAVAYATKNHDALMKEAKVYSKPAKLDPKIARHPKVKAAQKSHASGDWDGNVDKEGNAVVHIMGKPYTVTEGVINEGTEVGETKWASVNIFAGGDKMGGRGVQISGLNGQGKSNMELVRQKGAYMQLPLKEVPKLIKLLQKAVSMKNEETELDEGMTPAQKAAHAKAIAAFKARGGKVTKLPPGKAAGYHGKDDPGSGVHGMLSKPDSKKFNTKKKVRSMTADTQKESVDMKSFFDVRKAATLDVNQLDEYMGGGGMSGFQGQANRNKYGEHGANPHHHMDHAKAAFKSGMKSKSAIIKHVQNKTGQRIHPDVHKAIHNTPGLKD